MTKYDNSKLFLYTNRSKDAIISYKNYATKNYYLMVLKVRSGT